MSRRSRTRNVTSTNKGLEKKLARYALAGGAVLAAPLVAQGQIQYSGIVDDTIMLGMPATVDLPGTALTFTAGYNAPVNGTYGQSITAGGTSVFFIESGSSPLALTSGSYISVVSATGTDGLLLKYGGEGGVGFKGGNWPTNHSPAYLGFEFTTAGQMYAGWAEVSVDVDGTQGNPMGTLISYAYDETPDQLIDAGETGSSATPEPASLALFAIGGAAALALLRRRRAAARQP